MDKQVIKTTVTPRERKMVLAAAKASHLSIASWVRSVILDAANGKEARK